MNKLKATKNTSAINFNAPGTDDDEIFPADQKSRLSFKRKGVPGSRFVTGEVIAPQDEPTDKELEWQKYFTESEDDVPMVIIIWGPEGCGKTELAFKLAPSGNVYLVETEGGHNTFTGNKVKKSRTDIKVLECILDANTNSSEASMKWFSGGGDAWQKAEKVFESLQHAPSGTVILDSGSDLLPLVISQFSIDWDRGDKAFPQMLYGQCYGRLRGVINRLRLTHNVIITAQEKDKYKSNTEVAIKIGTKMNLWNNADHLSEHVIRVENDDDGNRNYILRENKSRTLILKDITWDELVNGVGDKKVSQSRLIIATERFSKGLSMCIEVGADVSGIKIGETTEEILEQVEQLKGIYKTSKAELDKAKDAEKQARLRKPKQSVKTDG